MNVLVAIGDPGLQREVAAGLDGAGFGVVEAAHPGPIPALPDDASAAPDALHAAVLGHGLGFDALAFGAVLRGRHPRIGVVYLVGDPLMADRTRALDHRCERTALRPLPGGHLCMALLARMLGQATGSAGGGPP